MEEDKPWLLVYYLKPSGRCPVEEFLDALQASDPKAYVALFDVCLPQMEKAGPSVGEPHFKYLPDEKVPKLGEIRWQHGRKKYRIYCTIESNRRIVFYHAVRKAWQKFDRTDREITRKRYDDYHTADYSGAERRRLRRA